MDGWEPLFGAVGLLLTAVGGFLVALAKGWIHFRKAKTEQDVTRMEAEASKTAKETESDLKKAKVSLDLEHKAQDHAIDQWRAFVRQQDESLEKLRAKVDALQDEHTQCQIELASARTRLHDVEEQQKQLQARLHRLEGSR